MATHTHSGSGGTTRWFSIGRKNFEATGKPVFKEYRKTMPPEDQRKGRVFEEREGAFYEVFEEMDGMFVDFQWKIKSIQGRDQSMFYIVLQDDNEKYVIEIGNWDGRYSMNFMQRICDTRFNPHLKISVRPYAGTNRETGKPYFGINVTNGIDQSTSKPLVLEPRKYEQGFFEIPKVEPTTKRENIGPGQWKETLVYDFSFQAQYLVDYLTNEIRKVLPTDVWEAAPVVADDEGANNSVSHPNIPAVQNGMNANRTEPTGDQFFPSDPNANSYPPPVSTDDLPF